MMIKKVLKKLTGKDNFIAIDNNRFNSPINIVKFLKHSNSFAYFRLLRSFHR